MVRPGWYADPGGAPGLYRFWDGVQWTTLTTTDPRTTPTTTTAPTTATPNPYQQTEPPAQPRRRGLRIAAVGLALGVAVLGSVAFVAVRSFGGSDPYTDDPLPTSTVSGWDDSSRAPSPAPSATPTASIGRCAAGLPPQSVRPPSDGRVHGGPLSYAQLRAPWSAPTGSARFPYGRDAYTQTHALPEDLPWIASLQVGVLSLPGYSGVDAAADVLLRCVMASDFYTSVDVRLARHRPQTVTVGTTRTARLDAQLAFRHPRLTTTGSDLRIIVVESDPVTYYFHAVPKERRDLIADLDTATASLRVG